MKILMVDRDELTLFFYKEELNDAGHEVVSLRWGHVVLETIEKEKPQALILGVRLMGFGNFELLEQVKAAYPDLPVIFNTSLADLWDDAKIKGADFINQKSIDLTGLKKAIETIEKLENGN